jgi:hypothetical protein
MWVAGRRWGWPHLRDSPCMMLLLLLLLGAWGSAAPARLPWPPGVARR